MVASPGLPTHTARYIFVIFLDENNFDNFVTASGYLPANRIPNTQI